MKLSVGNGHGFGFHSLILRRSSLVFICLLSLSGGWIIPRVDAIAVDVTIASVAGSVSTSTPQTTPTSSDGPLYVRQLPSPSLSITTSSSSSPATTTAASLPLAPSIIPSSPPSPVPTPMDLQISYALSKPCLLYLTSLLSSPEFTSCLPFSLLLTTSTSFGTLLSSATAPTDGSNGGFSTLNNLLAYVSNPQPSGETCDAFLSNAALEMGDKGRCDADLKARVPAAREAQTGLGNAGIMRTAAGLKDPDTGSWCYLEAVASSKPDDLYLWSLPSGIRLPQSTRPTCSKCSRLLLTHYAQSAPDTPTLNSTIVNNAVAVINAACGQNFAEFYATGSASVSAAGGSIGGPQIGLWTLAVLAFTTMRFGCW